MKNNKLQSVVERVESLEAEKAQIAEAIKEVYLEAKSNGYDVKIIRKIVAARKKTESEREAERAIMELYMKDLGMLADTPLGRAAIKKAGFDPDFD